MPPPTRVSAVEGSAAKTWQEIECLIEEIARLSKQPISARAFHTKLIDHAVSSLAAVGGALWTINRQDEMELAYQINLSAALSIDDANQVDPKPQRQHAQLLAEAVRRGKPTLVPPRCGDRDTSNPTPYLLAFVSVCVHDESVALLEIILPSGASPAAQDGYLRILAAIAELAADFHQSQQLRQLRRRESLWNELDQFAQRIHGSLDLDKTAMAIANDGRHLIGCDRVSVLIQRGGRSRVAAISGVDTFDRRAHLVRAQERLAHLLVRANEPLWVDGDAEPPAPKIEQILNTYLDASQARMLAVIPLSETVGRGRRSRERPLGALVVENFEAGISTEQRECVAIVASHSRIALGNATAVRNIPLMPLWQLLSRVGWLLRLRQLPKTLFVLAAVAALSCALAMIETDFTIRARGELQPASRQFVFAPSAGVVDQLHVDHGSLVEAGQLLAVLRDPQLELEQRRVWAEIETAGKRLTALETSRLTEQPTGSQSRAQQQRLTAEAEEVKQQLRGLARQQKILQQQHDELRLRSPIDGQVLTWDVHQLLDARPVTRGQALLTIADSEGPWVLEVRVPDDQVGHMLRAQDELGGELDVDFLLETAPGVVHHGKVGRLAMNSDRTNGDGTDLDSLSVLVTVRFDRETLEAGGAHSPRSGALRPGAGVITHFQCGRRSIGYVWLRGLIETFDKWWF